MKSRFATLAAAALIGAAFTLPVTITSAEAATKKATHHKVGSPAVKNAQEALNRNGATLAVDGKMGKKTIAALKSFQKKNGLKATGKLDAKTKSALGVA